MRALAVAQRSLRDRLPEAGSRRQQAMGRIEVKPMPGETSDLVLAGTKRAWIDTWARV